MDDWYTQIEGAGSSRVGPKTSTDKADGFDTVTQAPAELAQAAGLSVDVYSLARMISSENGSEAAPYLLALAETTRNYAASKGSSVTRLLTRSKYTHVDGMYSEQAAGKWASTRLDPKARHVEAARIALDERSNVFGGAVDFFDPRSQDGRAQNGRALKLTSEDYINRNAKDGLEWIGPVDGVNEYHLMLFAKRSPADPSAALAALDAGRSGQKVAVVAAATGLIAGGLAIATALYFAGVRI